MHKHYIKVLIVKKNFLSNLFNSIWFLFFYWFSRRFQGFEISHLSTKTCVHNPGRIKSFCYNGSVRCYVERRRVVRLIIHECPPHLQVPVVSVFDCRIPNQCYLRTGSTPSLHTSPFSHLNKVSVCIAGTNESVTQSNTLMMSTTHA